MDNQAKLDEWNAVKKGIDRQNIRRQANPKRIFWVSIGQNVGSEVYGKSEIFTRPVLVIKAFFNHTFLGVPLTSKTQNKSGKFYHKFTDSKGKEQVALLGQIRIFDARRIETYIGKVKDCDFAEIKRKIKNHIAE